jgi:hypothetical protein
MTYRKLLRLVPGAACIAVLSLAACSSSSGGGSSHPSQPNVVVLPPGQKIVCENGQPPPCQ